MENQEILKLIDRIKKVCTIFIRVSLLLIVLKLSFDLRDMMRYSAYWGGKSVLDMLFSLVLNFLGYSIVCILVFVFVLAVMMARFRRRAVKELREQFRSLIRSDSEWVWGDRPGIFSIDCQGKYLLINSFSTKYTAIRLDSGNILSSKVERSVFVETETTHGPGSLSDVLDNRYVSRSISSPREVIVLEITYKGSDNLPYVVSIPFGEDRISAERAQHMIQMFA